MFGASTPVIEPGEHFRQFLGGSAYRKRHRPKGQDRCAARDAGHDYGTNFAKEVGKLNGKPYYPPRQMPAPADKPN